MIPFWEFHLRAHLSFVIVSVVIVFLLCFYSPEWWYLSQSTFAPHVHIGWQPMVPTALDVPEVFVTWSLFSFSFKHWLLTCLHCGSPCYEVVSNRVFSVCLQKMWLKYLTKTLIAHLVENLEYCLIGEVATKIGITTLLKNRKCVRSAVALRSTRWQGWAAMPWQNVLQKKYIYLVTCNKWHTRSSFW